MSETTRALRRFLRRVRRARKAVVNPPPKPVTTMDDLKRAIHRNQKQPCQYPHPDGTARQRWQRSGSHLSFRDWCIENIERAG